MPYLGNVPAEAYTNTVKDSYNGDGSTTAFTLSQPSTTNNLRVVVENVIQDPTVAYTVSGTTLTFTSAPPVGTANIYAVHLGPAVQTAVPPSEINNATTYTSDLTVQGAFTSVGIDDNATSTAMTIDSSGNVTLTGGIYLGGTGSANKLDDYEEGTWTPAYSTTGNNFSSITYNTTFTSGTYVKVGRNVTLRGYIRTEALTLGSATGGVIVTGIPFTSSNGINTITDTRCAGSVLSTNFSADGPSTLVINNNKTYFEPYSHNTIGSGTSGAILNAADMRTTATSNIMTFTLNYYVD